MAFDEMISLLSKAIGIGLQIEDGICGFKAGDADDDAGSVNIMISNVEERGEILLYADLGNVPPEGREDFYRTLLEANNLFQGTAGATLSLENGTGLIRLQMRENSSVFANNAEEHVGIFVDTALTWKKIVVDYRASRNESKPAEEDVHDNSSFMSPFMQV